MPFRQWLAQRLGRRVADHVCSHHGKVEDVMISKRAFLATTLATAVQAIAGAASAQTYPARTLKILVPFPAGGPTDLVARLVADRLSAGLGQSVIVEDRPGGAGGSIGAKAVAASDPDGYTLLLTPVDVLTQAPLVYRDVGYDPLRNFAPVALIMTAPLILVVNPSVPAKTLQELAAYAKANSGKVRYGSPGFGTSPHVVGELFKAVTGASITHVPYRGSAPAINDLLAGQVQIYTDTITILLPHIEAGSIRALAVLNDSGTRYLPNVPSTVEAGFPMLQQVYTLALYAPAGTPAGIIDRLNAATNETLKTDTLQTGLSKLGAVALGGSVPDVSAYMAANTKKAAEMVAAAGIQPE
jgi:tripartite-type tricarboxylate transporter receptor subunit TctC